MPNNVYDACGTFLTSDGHTKQGTFEVPAEERPSDLVNRLTMVAAERYSPVYGIVLTPNGDSTGDSTELVPLEHILIFMDERFNGSNGNDNEGPETSDELNKEFSYGNHAGRRYIREIPDVSIQVGEDYVVEGTILHQSDYSDPRRVLSRMKSGSVPYIRVKDARIQGNGTSLSAGVCLVRIDSAYI